MRFALSTLSSWHKVTPLGVSMGNLTHSLTLRVGLLLNSLLRIGMLHGYMLCVRRLYVEWFL